MKQIKALFTLVLLASLTSCSTESSSTPPNTVDSPTTSSESTSTPVETSNQEDFFWQIEITSAERTQNLENTQSFTLYGGDIEDVDYSATANDGFEYLILELSIDKAGAGGNPFDWSSLYVEDSSGNQYYRMENDKFLEDYNFPRINGTSLTLGGNEGFISVEIPTSSSGLTLNHETEDGKNTIPLPQL